MYSSKMTPLSASRMRCMTTCLAICAAMRPNDCGVISCSMTSPDSWYSFMARASSSDIWPAGSSTVSTTCLAVKTRISPVSRSRFTRTLAVEPKLRLYAEISEDSMASISTSLLMRRSFSIASKASIRSVFIKFSPRMTQNSMCGLMLAMSARSNVRSPPPAVSVIVPPS